MRKQHEPKVDMAAVCLTAFFVLVILVLLQEAFGG
jgi:hypothetical protein